MVRVSLFVFIVLVFSSCDKIFDDLLFHAKCEVVSESGVLTNDLGKAYVDIRVKNKGWQCADDVTVSLKLSTGGGQVVERAHKDVGHLEEHTSYTCRIYLDVVKSHWDCDVVDSWVSFVDCDCKDDYDDDDDDYDDWIF